MEGFCNRIRGSCRRRTDIIYLPTPCPTVTTALLRPPGRTSRPSPLTVNCNTLACSSLAPPLVRPHHYPRTIMAPRAEQSQLKRAAVRSPVPLLAYTPAARPHVHLQRRLHAHRVFRGIPHLAVASQTDRPCRAYSTRLLTRLFPMPGFARRARP